MTNYNDGKIHGWNGGECPVHPETRVSVWFRGGFCISDASAGSFLWGHMQDKDDLIALQVVKEYREPTTIWRNEYREFSTFYFSEEEARAAAKNNCLRVAVEYAEVVK